MNATTLKHMAIVAAVLMGVFLVNNMTGRKLESIAA